MIPSVTRRRPLVAPLVLTGLWSLAACGQGHEPSGKAAVQNGAVTIASRSNSEATASPHPAKGRAHCRDFSDLDLATLPALPKGPHVASFEAVWRTVLEKYYDPTLGCTDWPALRLAYGGRVAQAKGSGEATQITNELLERLGQSHFRVLSPAPQATFENQGPAQPPFTVRWVDDQLIVTASSVRKVPPGSVLRSIDDNRVDRLVEVARQASRRPEEFPFRVRRQAELALSCAPQDRKVVRFLHPRRSDAEVSHLVDCELPPGERLSMGNLRDVPSLVQSRVLAGGKVGYLAFNVWLLPLVAHVERALEDLRAQGITALVLDLRGNPGGVGPMAVPVARLLLAEGGSLGKMTFRDFTNEFKVSANPNAFRGPVVVLIDEGTASTSEIFVAGMRDLGRVTIIGGQRSAGAALPSLIETLDGGAVLQYVVGDYHSPNGTLIEGQGVLPDVLVEEHREDFIEGRDPVLDASIHFLEHA